ncbi:hypothetical protein [Dysgonomonas massiliensis]|uniref:hypothetical protein n=1 Tax=Dysgonomonas massiliensis TaxID=2040292 RepID=UPI000C781871|nr:hypothetical protein [Dysgonomonas massiliensis]
MPPYYDIYGISQKRDKETIERFLDFFAEREMIENREDQEIYVMNNEKYGTKEVLISINTLSEVIEYGVNNQDSGFVFYIGDYLKDVDHIILKFTYDRKIIFGISVEEKIFRNNQLIDNYTKAKKVEDLILQLTSAYKTSIQFEFPPADDEEEFDESMEMWRNMNESKKIGFHQ